MFECSLHKSSKCPACVPVPDGKGAICKRSKHMGG